jgi:DNA-binding transcriptional LysR family regulator
MSALLAGEARAASGRPLSVTPPSLPNTWTGINRRHRLGTRNSSISGFESVGAALSYRETGDPFPGAWDTWPALRIGLCSPLSLGFLRDLIRKVRSGPDPLALSFIEGTTHNIIRASIRREIDVGFVFGLQDWSQLQHEELWREPLMVVMSDDHPLACESDVNPEALRGETFLVAGDSAERERHMELLARTIGDTPPVVLAVPVERATIVDLVSLGFGLALTTGSALGAFHPGVQYRPIRGPIEPTAFHAIWRQSNGHEDLARFLTTARALAAGWRS